MHVWNGVQSPSKGMPSIGRHLAAAIDFDSSDGRGSNFSGILGGKKGDDLVIR